MEPNQARILLFPPVLPDQHQVKNAMSLQLFEQVIQYLQKKYEIISLEDYFFRERKIFVKPPVIITFDNSYRNFLEYTFPVLKKYNVRATLFVVTDCITSGMPLWDYTIDFLFATTNKLSVGEYYGKAQLPVESKWKSTKSRINDGRRIADHLKKVTPQQQKKIVDFYLQQFDDVTLHSEIMLSWENLNSLKAHGIEIGSQTKTFAVLTSLKEEKDFDMEMKQSSDIIRQKTGFSPAALAYPFGLYNSKVKNYVHRYGYKLALGTEQKIYNVKTHGRFTLPRIQLYNESFLKTRLRIDGVISKLLSLTGG